VYLSRRRRRVQLGDLSELRRTEESCGGHKRMAADKRLRRWRVRAWVRQVSCAGRQMNYGGQTTRRQVGVDKWASTSGDREVAVDKWGSTSGIRRTGVPPAPVRR
jgi:hypothetical protein